MSELRPILKPDTRPVTPASAERNLRQCMTLHEDGVTYEAIERRALDDDLSFNEAVDSIYSERHSNASASA